MLRYISAGGWYIMDPMQMEVGVVSSDIAVQTGKHCTRLFPVAPRAKHAFEI